jgi:streptomycin 6-kinase
MSAKAELLEKAYSFWWPQGSLSPKQSTQQQSHTAKMNNNRFIASLVNPSESYYPFRFPMPEWFNSLFYQTKSF